MERVKIKDNPWVKEQIASTNGIHYEDQVQKIDTYPEYNLPVPKVEKKGKLMLDIGTGWGRWLVAASKKNYVPVGVDIKFEHAQAALKTIRAHGVNGYVVVGDLQDLPFQDDVFDLIWSFSVIQHTHIDKLTSGLAHISRILAKGGHTKLEFPNKNGIRNKLKYGRVENDMNLSSLHVRYYTMKEYKRMFEKHFPKFNFSVHSFFGLGVLPEDLKYVSSKIKPQVALVLLSTFFSRIIPGMKYLADSVYIKTEKTSGAHNKRIHHFLKHHWLKENLNIVYLLQCPISGGPVYLSKDSKFVISDNAGVKYPVIEDIPIMLRKAAIPMERKSRSEAEYK